MRLSPKERKKRGCDELDISRTSPELAHRTGLSYGIGYERGSDWDWGGCRGGLHRSLMQSYFSHSGSIISSTPRIILGLEAQRSRSDDAVRLMKLTVKPNSFYINFTYYFIF